MAVAVGHFLGLLPTPKSNLSSNSDVGGFTEHTHREWRVKSGDKHREIKVFISESRLFFPVPRSGSSKDEGFYPVTALLYPPGDITFQGPQTMTPTTPSPIELPQWETKGERS